MSPGPGHTHFSPANESDVLTAAIHSTGQIESGSKSEPLQRSDSNDPLALGTSEPNRKIRIFIK